MTHPGPDQLCQTLWGPNVSAFKAPRRFHCAASKLSDAGTRTLRLTATTTGVLEAAGNESYNSWDWFEAVEPVGKPYV